MANLSHDPDTGDNSIGTGDEVVPGIPRWVYAFAIMAFILVLVFIIMHLMGGAPGGH